MCNSLSFSQSLKPKIQSIDSIKHFCFTLPQSKIMAKQLQQMKSTDSVMYILKKNNDTYKKLLVFKDEILTKTNVKTANLNQVSIKKGIQIGILKQSLTKEKKKCKRRTLITQVGGVLAVITGIIIAK